MRKSVIGRKTPQDVTECRKTLQNAWVQYEYWVGYSNEQSTPSMDKAATIIPGHCSVAVSTLNTLKLLYFLGHYTQWTTKNVAVYFWL